MEPGPCSGVGGISEGPAAALLCEEGSVAGVHRALNPETKDLGYSHDCLSLWLPSNSLTLSGPCFLQVLWSISGLCPQGSGLLRGVNEDNL